MKLTILGSGETCLGFQPRLDTPTYSSVYIGIFAKHSVRCCRKLARRLETDILVPCTKYIGMHVLLLEPIESLIVEWNDCLEGCAESAFIPNTNSDSFQNLCQTSPEH